MNKSYLNKNELIIVKVDDGWYDESNSIILVEDIKPFQSLNKNTIFNKYFVKIKHFGKLQVGVKYIVESILSYFGIDKAKEIIIQYSGDSVTDYLGPREILIGKNPSEKLWGKEFKEYKFQNYYIKMYFQKVKGWTRQNISQKNGETIHYSIILKIKNISNINDFIYLIRMHHDFIFGFQWLENEEIKFGYDFPIRKIYFNEDVTINHGVINQLKPYYLGDARFIKSSNLELFMQTYNFINIIRNNNFFEIKINILSTISEMLFENFYIKKYGNGKKIKNLSSKLKWIMPIDKTCAKKDIVDDFKNARDSTSHWLNKKYDRELAEKVIENIIWLWCYFINNNNPEMAISRIFPNHNNSKKTNNYSIYEKVKYRLEKINENNHITYIHSTLDNFKETIWEKDVINMVDQLLINDYIFIHPNGYKQKFRISDEHKNSYFLISIEQGEKDYNKENISIKYSDLINLSKSKLKNTKLFFEKIIKIVKPKLK